MHWLLYLSYCVKGASVMLLPWPIYADIYIDGGSVFYLPTSSSWLLLVFSTIKCFACATLT